MLPRLTYLENRKTLGDSGELTVDISMDDPITAFWVEFRATNGGTNNQSNPLVGCIDAIEVIDGSQVLFSLDGPEALAFTAYYLGHMPDLLVDEFASNIQNCSVLIPFGRRLWDKQYAFDPGRYRNPQIRVKWNLANVTAVGATGFLTTTGRLTVMALVMEGSSRPSRYLSAKQHYTSAGAASGQDFIDLPMDAPLAGLLVRAHKAGTPMYNVLDDLKLSLDNDKHVVYNMPMADVLRLWNMTHAPFAYRHVFDATNGDTISTLLRQGEIVHAHASDANDVVFGNIEVGYGQSVIRLYTAGSAETSDLMLMATVQGYAPMACVWCPIGSFGDPADVLPIESFRSARLIVDQEAATSTIAVCVVQDRAYA